MIINDGDDRQMGGVLQRGSSESGLLLGGSLHNLLIFDSMVMIMMIPMAMVIKDGHALKILTTNSRRTLTTSTTLLGEYQPARVTRSPSAQPMLGWTR